MNLESVCERDCEPSGSYSAARKSTEWQQSYKKIKKTHEIKKSSAMLLRPTHLTAAPCCAAGIGIMVVDGLPGFDVKFR